MADQIDISTTAGEPKRVTVDGQTVEQHGLKDQIEADKHIAAKNAASRSAAPMRLFKIRPPAAP